MSIYYAIQDIIGSTNCIESYNMFIQIEDWCNKNLSHYWEFVNPESVLLQGIRVPAGIRFTDVQDAIKFNSRF